MDVVRQQCGGAPRCCCAGMWHRGSAGVHGREGIEERHTAEHPCGLSSACAFVVRALPSNATPRGEGATVHRFSHSPDRVIRAIAAVDPYQGMTAACQREQTGGICADLKIESGELE